MCVCVCVCVCVPGMMHHLLSIGVQASTRRTQAQIQSGLTSEYQFQVHSSLILKLLGFVFAGRTCWRETRLCVCVCTCVPGMMHHLLSIGVQVSTCRARAQIQSGLTSE